MLKSTLLLKEQELIADIKGRTDRVLQVDIAGVFFSAVFSGVLMVTKFFSLVVYLLYLDSCLFCVQYVNSNRAFEERKYLFFHCGSNSLFRSYCCSGHSVCKVA
jgi:hypothetical protein